MRSAATLALLGAAALVVAAADAQTSSQAGYEVTKSQTVASTPARHVGRKTTDRETRVGNTPETDGNSQTLVMTVGGFARECPTAEGVVAGNFEYTVTSDEVNTDEGETRRSHHSVSLIAQLEGQVRDDGRLDSIRVIGDFTKQREGSPPERQHIDQRFRVGAQGQPDMAAMLDAVTATADLSIAVVMWMGSTIYTQAETHWNMRDACIEFVFEPPTETRMFGPNGSAQVRATIRTKENLTPIANVDYRANALAGIGTLTPHEGRTEPNGTIEFTYTATANPKNSHGFDVGSQNRAGFATAEWKIRAAVPFEGTFTQRRLMNISGAGLPEQARALGADRYGVGFSADDEITGSLRWTPEENSARPSSFGDLGSVFYVPTDGEITVKVGGDGRSIAGNCTHEGSKTFPLRQLPPAALQYLVLELAGDGRYKIWLGMLSYYLQFQVETKCRVRTGQRLEQPFDINDAGIVLGQQEGVVTNETIAGETPAPIVIGYDRYTGRWEFRKVEPRP
jgi:hypothetical protein